MCWSNFLSNFSRRTRLYRTYPKFISQLLGIYRTGKSYPFSFLEWSEDVRPSVSIFWPIGTLHGANPSPPGISPIGNWIISRKFDFTAKHAGSRPILISWLGPSCLPLPVSSIVAFSALGCLSCPSGSLGRTTASVAANPIPPAVTSSCAAAAALAPCGKMIRPFLVGRTGESAPNDRGVAFLANSRSHATIIVSGYYHFSRAARGGFPCAPALFRAPYCCSDNSQNQRW